MLRQMIKMPMASLLKALDTLRRQARHRLIGATVLVLLAVIGFPLVFDTKPRELAADIRIEMPDKDAVRPSQAPDVRRPPWLPAPAPVPDCRPASTRTHSRRIGSQVCRSAFCQMPEKASTGYGQRGRSSLQSLTPGSEKSGDSAPRFIVQVGAFAEESKSKEVR